MARGDRGQIAVWTPGKDLFMPAASGRMAD
jgi:hypothetical protein